LLKVLQCLHLNKKKQSETEEKKKKRFKVSFLKVFHILNLKKIYVKKKKKKNK